MANVNADTAKLDALMTTLSEGRGKFTQLNNDMNKRLNNAHSFWQDNQYTYFCGKFNQDVYSAIDEMCKEMDIFVSYLERKIGQLNSYLNTQI